MAITVAEFRIRFPEFSNVTDYPDARIQLFIDDASTIYMGSDETRWCNYYNIAQAYLAAHLLYTAEQASFGNASANVGPISSKSAGGVSVTKAVQVKLRSDGDEYFMTTQYGQRYITLRNQCFTAVFATNEIL